MDFWGLQSFRAARVAIASQRKLRMCKECSLPQDAWQSFWRRFGLYQERTHAGNCSYACIGNRDPRIAGRNP